MGPAQGVGSDGIDSLGLTAHYFRPHERAGRRCASDAAAAVGHRALDRRIRRVGPVWSRVPMWGRISPSEPDHGPVRHEADRRSSQARVLTIMRPVPPALHARLLIALGCWAPPRRAAEHRSTLHTEEFCRRQAFVGQNVECEPGAIPMHLGRVGVGHPRHIPGGDCRPPAPRLPRSFYSPRPGPGGFVVRPRWPGCRECCHLRMATARRRAVRVQCRGR